MENPRKEKLAIQEFNNLDLTTNWQQLESMKWKKLQGMPAKRKLDYYEI
jgi:hypothetical protein